MTLRKIKEILKAKVICCDEKLDEEVKFAGGSDLMSDVLAFSKPGSLLLTGLTNAQSVRTADIVEAIAIVYVRGKMPTKEGIDLAKKKGIPILSTEYMMYNACGLLYENGLRGVTDN